jgi:hypothetical protein
MHVYPTPWIILKPNVYLPSGMCRFAMGNVWLPCRGTARAALAQGFPEIDPRNSLSYPLLKPGLTWDLVFVIFFYWPFLFLIGIISGRINVNLPEWFIILTGPV